MGFVASSVRECSYKSNIEKLLTNLAFSMRIPHNGDHYEMHGKEHALHSFNAIDFPPNQLIKIM